MRELFSVEEATEALGFGKTRLYQEMAAGRLLSVLVGRRRLIPRSAIETHVDDLVAEQAGNSGAVTAPEPSASSHEAVTLPPRRGLNREQST